MSRLTKTKLIQKLAEREDIKLNDATTAVNLVFKSMIDTLANGDSVQIRGFCSFKVKEYKSYEGRNPKTGKKTQVLSKKLPFFRCGTELKKRINQG